MRWMILLLCLLCPLPALADGGVPDAGISLPHAVGAPAVLTAAPPSVTATATPSPSPPLVAAPPAALATTTATAPIPSPSPSAIPKPDPIEEAATVMTNPVVPKFVEGEIAKQGSNSWVWATVAAGVTMFFAGYMLGKRERTGAGS